MEVNSHDGVPSITDLASQHWQRSRHWFKPQAHPLLQRVLMSKPSAATVRFAGLLRQPVLAYTGEFLVHGQRIIPAAIAMEVSCAALLLCHLGKSWQEWLCVQH
jgi:hypothetical protein